MTTKNNEHPFERLAKRAEQAKQRQQEAASLSSEISGDSLLSSANNPESPELLSQRKTTFVSHNVLSAIESNYLCGEQMGLFDSFPIKSKGEFPSLLCRLPIFMPTDRRKQVEYLDQDLGLVFDTPFGKGRRLGPPLTVTDEDVLMACARLRKKRLHGNCENLPIPVPNKYAKYAPSQSMESLQDGKVYVDTVVCTVAQILEELGLSNGGENYKKVIASMKRLGALHLEITVNKHNRYFGDMDLGTPIRLLDIEWVTFKEHGIFTVQFTPIMVLWFEREYTFIDWNIRKQLKGESAKAIHRFLSSQGYHYKGEIAKIAETVGIREPSYKRKTVFDKALKQLQELGWLERYEITGTGRNKPHVMEMWRQPRNGKRGEDSSAS
jgi:hypothetical protein